MSDLTNLLKTEVIDLNVLDGIKRKNRHLHHYFRHRGKERCIDFILAAKTDSDAEKISKKRQFYIHNLKRKRLKVSTRVLSQDEKTQFWHIHAPFDVLCDIAEDLNVRLPTQENDIQISVWYDKARLRFNDWWRSINPFEVQHSYFEQPKCYFDDIFDKNRLDEFLNGNSPGKLFTNTERSRLVSYILESTPFDEKEDIIGISALIDLDVFTAAYPCHDGPLLRDYRNEPCINMRQKLSKEWASFRKIFKYQPIHAIKDYFGVKVAFYYAWIGFYTTFLVPASIVGMLCFFYGALSNIWFEPVNETCFPKNASLYYMCPLCDKFCSYYLLKDVSCLYAKITHLFDNDATPFLAVFIAIWSVFYLEYWKRKQSTLAYQWYTTDFYGEEVVRPQFSAVIKRLRKNPVTGKKEPSMSKKEEFVKMVGVFTVVVFFIALVISALIGVIVYRAAIYAILISSGGTLRSNSKLLVAGTAACINLLVINILKVIYNRLAIVMTNWENPRTNSAYERSFTLKMFWFQFCNTYASVFYVAFFKTEIFVGRPNHYNRFVGKSYRLEGCSSEGCFLELCVQLIILMCGQQLCGNIIEVLLPFVKKKYNSWKHNVKHSQDVPVWEADYQLTEQDQLSLFWEYQEVALQYGFVTMFVAAFPLAPLIALITNLVEIRIDAINNVKAFRRPVAYKSEGIGVWYDILTTVTAFAVLVNGFVLAVTSEFIPRTVYQYQFSPDGTLKGYLNWSLSHFNVNDFNDMERPEDATLNVATVQQYCRYAGFHKTSQPHKHTIIHWEITTFRLIFAFLFQWTVTVATRVIAWIIPDVPTSLQLKIKRQDYLAAEALRKYKIMIGKRKPEKDSSGSEEEIDNISLNSESSCCKTDRHRSRSRTQSRSRSGSNRSTTNLENANLSVEKQSHVHNKHIKNDEIVSDIETKTYAEVNPNSSPINERRNKTDMISMTPLLHSFDDTKLGLSKKTEGLEPPEIHLNDLPLPVINSNQPQFSRWEYLSGWQYLRKMFFSK